MLLRANHPVSLTPPFVRVRGGGVQMRFTTPNATEKQDDEHRNKRTQELTLPFFVGVTLLPGDGKLSQTQKQRLLDAKEALDARYPDRPTSIDPDEYED